MRNVIYIGDIHGNVNYILSYIERNKITNTDLIQVGDFGIGFKNHQQDTDVLILINTRLHESNNKLFVIRGNHDNPNYFDGKFIYSNIKLLEDYTVLTLGGKKTLFVGGAISIDRLPRINRDICNINQTYWKNEEFKLDLDKLSKIDLESIEVLVTHTTTEKCLENLLKTNTIKSGIVEMFITKYNDIVLQRDLDNENRLVTELVSMLPNIKQHYYGHYHASNKFIDGDCEHILLDINEFLNGK